MADSFVGRFVVESKDNYDGFMKGVGELEVRVVRTDYKNGILSRKV